MPLCFYLLNLQYFTLWNKKIIIIMAFGDWKILSREGAQQGDPLGSLQFCEALQALHYTLCCVICSQYDSYE